MTVQPKFHWQFQKNSGDIIRDTLSQTKGKLFKASLNGHGRIGKAIQLAALDSRVLFERKVGQFGTSDFTVAFGIKILDPFNQNDTNLIGNRNTSGHGNWFSLRLEGKGTTLSFEVDENTKGKNYVVARARDLSGLANKTWQHIAIVRENRSIKLYLNGALISENKSRTGVANINSGVPMQLGHHTRHTPAAQYEDLRVYHTALSTTEINDLIPPVNRPLREGEIELVATDGAAVILKKDIENLFRFSQQFKTLRVGPDTAVALFKKADFGGTAQLLYADLPDIKLSRLKDFPASVRIRSAIGNPFTGKWLIKAPNGQFLSLINLDGPLRGVKTAFNAVITTSPKRSFNALFKLQKQPGQARSQLIHDANKEKTLFRVSPKTEAIPLFVEELRPLSGEFAIVNQAKNQWLEMGEKNTFKWTDREEKRAVFARVAKMADRENQVGELAPGEVALYQHVAYHGRTWILSDTEKDLSGEYPNLSVFQSLQDETSSIRLGPETGVTVFREDKFRGSLKEKTVRPIGRPPIIVRREANLSRARIFGKRRKKGVKFVDAREKIQEAIEAAQASLVEDIIENVPNLSDSQIGDDTISSLKIFRTVEPEDVFSSYTTKLSQDYKMVGDKLEEFSAYRTTLRFEPSDNKVKVEVSATDLTKIEVDGTVYKIDESRSVTLSPNEMNRIVITSEADGIDTPGLKIRTNAMALNERVVIFPNQEAHQQIAELEEGALWNAKDSQGNFVVDREAHSKEEVASVQNTIKRMMATVAYTDEAPASSSPNSSANVRSNVVAGRRVANVRAARPQKAGRQERPRVQSSSRVVSSATIDQPWKLEFKPANNNSQLRFARAVSRGANDSVGAASPTENRQSLSASTPTTLIQEAEVSQDEFAQLLSRAIPEETARPPVSNLPGQARFIKLPNPFKEIKDAVQSGFSTVIGIAEGVVNVLVDTAQGVFRFVVDTVEKVAEFVEAVVNKVVKSIKQFIEFLQFLFDWDDILATQRFLFKTINSAFDSADDLVTLAKGHVSSFVDDLQETLNEGTDSIIKSLGGDPTEENKDDTFELPEAAEWFLNKVLGGSKSSKSQTATNAGTADDSASDSFQRALESLLEALTDIAGAGLEVFDGLVDTVQILIANPRRPELALIELLDSIRDVGIKLLDAGENITLAFLDLVVTAIRLFQDALNAEIRIPFISDLFKLLGAGKLTILNLLSLLVAIPVTVVSKLIFGEAPFKDMETLAFPVSQPSRQAAVSRSVTSEQSLLASKSAEPAIDIDKTRRKIRGFGALAWACDLLNSMIQAGLDLPSESTELKGGLSDFLEILSLGLSGFSWLASFPASTIEPGGYPYNIAHPDHNVSKSANEQAYWQRVMWGWRTGVLCFDILHMMASFKVGALQNQRLRRADQVTASLVTALMLVDLGLTSRFLRAAPKGQDKKGLRVASEILPMMPTIFCGLRFIEDPIALAARVAVNGISGIPISFNLLLVSDDAKAV
ncbi:MAG: LamG domain-containing protein [Cyanobacteria bacterium J06634_6]